MRRYSTSRRHPDLSRRLFGSLDACAEGFMVPSNPLDGARRQPLRIVAVVGVLVIAGFGAAFWLHPAKTQDHEIQSQAAASLTYIGAERCAGCHTQEAEAWRQSHHAQAMQEANASTVLGNFRDATIRKRRIDLQLLS